MMIYSAHPFLSLLRDGGVWCDGGVFGRLGFTTPDDNRNRMFIPPPPWPPFAFRSFFAFLTNITYIVCKHA